MNSAYEAVASSRPVLTAYLDNASKQFDIRDAQWDVEELLNRPLLSATIVMLLSYCLLSISQKATIQGPYVGYRSWWEPTWLLRLRFVQGARPIIADGYAKFKNSMFRIRRNDTDILVVSNKYVDELRSLPDDKATAIGAHIKNLLGPYSTTDLLLESNLHTRILQGKLTPNLARFIPRMYDELKFAMQEDIPEAEDWTLIAPYEISLLLVARISARVFVGLPTCRNREWLEASIRYTENIFETVIALRAFPAVLHPFLVRLLPSWYRIHQNLATARKLIVPLMESYQEGIASGQEFSDEERSTLLNWMIDEGTTPVETDPKKMAQRQLIMSLGAIHTTTMATAHALYDLCAHPEYFEPLREEVEPIVLAEGGFDKQSFLKMHKLESLMKESQRLNPPSLLAFNRILKEDTHLSDGTILKKGEHIAVASANILLDSSNVADPGKFDPFRSYNKRQEPGESNKHLWAMTDNKNLHFGHGKYSCPGRFFASNEIKMMLACLLTFYEFKYPEGQGRPQNFTADENIYPDPKARLLIRRRRKIDGI